MLDMSGKLALMVFWPAKLNISSLLSPTSAFSDLTPGALERSISLVQSTRDEDAVIFAEIAEYARSLIAVPKGQELPFPGLPQLLPYKLHRAWWAAELGDHDLAKRCTCFVTAMSETDSPDTAKLLKLLPKSVKAVHHYSADHSSTVWKIYKNVSRVNLRPNPPISLVVAKLVNQVSTSLVRGSKVV
jgi:hypothetical protein